MKKYLYQGLSNGCGYMKKVVIFLFCLFLISLNSFSLTVFEEESWISAYFYKNNLSPTEKFYPFIDIRQYNYEIDQPGNAVRTILADYILSLELDIVRFLLKLEGFNEANNVTDIISLLQNEIDINELEKYILEVKALNLFREEVLDRQIYLERYLGSSMYSIFKYKFYHLRLTQYERMTLIPEDPDLNINFSYEPDYFNKLSFGLEDYTSEDIIGKAVMTYLGVYNTPFRVEQGEIRDSVIATERINSMLPLYPYVLLSQANSPLVSIEINPLSLDMKREYLRRFDNPRFVWSNVVSVLDLVIDRIIVEDICNYFNLFNSLLQYLKGYYEEVFEEEYTGDQHYDLTSLNSLLIMIKTNYGGW